MRSLIQFMLVAVVIWQGTVPTINRYEHRLLFDAEHANDAAFDGLSAEYKDQDGLGGERWMPCGFDEDRLIRWYLKERLLKDAAK